MRVSQLQGLRYPDDYVTRFFFKTGLQDSPGRVLELGCGSGNNLLLFQQFGWDVTGLDTSHEALAQAHHNLSQLGKPEPAVLLEQVDLECCDLPAGAYDAVLLPNILSYLTSMGCIRLLQQSGLRLRVGGWFFVRTRNTRDYRYGRGREVARNSFRLEVEETGEMGSLQTFYEEHELVAFCLEHFHPQPETLKVLCSEFELNQTGRRVHNADHILWGRRQ